MAEQYREAALTAARLLDDKKAADIVLLQIDKVSLIADYFLICTATSAVHNHALCDHLIKEMKNAGWQWLRIEGYRDGQWILVDYGFLVIHLFLEQQRSLYNLERLWGMAPRVALENAAGNMRRG